MSGITIKAYFGCSWNTTVTAGLEDLKEIRPAGYRIFNPGYLNLRILIRHSPKAFTKRCSLEAKPLNL